LPGAANHSNHQGLLSVSGDAGILLVVMLESFALSANHSNHKRLLRLSGAAQPLCCFSSGTRQYPLPPLAKP
jgi:hypothetical protein